MLDLAALAPAVWEAGFAVTRIRIEAEGRVEGNAFRIAGWPDAFPLEGPVPDGPRIVADVHVDAGSIRLRATTLPDRTP